MPSDRYRFRGSVMPSAGARASILTPDLTEEGTAATLRLFDPIDSWGGEWGVSAKEFAEALDALPETVERITMHINSPGGEVFEAIAILNTLRGHRARVTAVVDGLAASAASVLATGVDELIMGGNTQLMIHDAWGVCRGNSADMADMASLLDRLSDNIAAIYAAKAGTDVAQWRAAMRAETWFSAEEAVAAGLADSVATPAPQPAAQFDLSGFRYQGRTNAPKPLAPPQGLPTTLARRALDHAMRRAPFAG